MHGGSLYGSLDGKEEQPFDIFNFLFEKSNGVLQYTEMYIKTHHWQFTRRKHNENMFLVNQFTVTWSSSTWFPLGTAPNTLTVWSAGGCTFAVGSVGVSPLSLASPGYRRSIHPPTHPSSKYCLNTKRKTALLCTFNCCGLSANWLKTQAIFYELLYFDMFEGADKRVWQLLKDLKNDKEFHYVTIKSKTLLCHLNHNTPVRPFVNSSIEMTI